MAEDYCEMWDLPASQCGHCRGIADPGQEPEERETSTPTVGPRFRTGTGRVAEYHTTCPGCGDDIDPGDTIKKDASESWVHEECA